MLRTSPVPAAATNLPPSLQIGDFGRQLERRVVVLSLPYESVDAAIQLSWPQRCCKSLLFPSSRRDIRVCVHSRSRRNNLNPPVLLHVAEATIVSYIYIYIYIYIYSYKLGLSLRSKSCSTAVLAKAKSVPGAPN